MPQAEGEEYDWPMIAAMMHACGLLTSTDILVIEDRSVP